MIHTFQNKSSNARFDFKLWTHTAATRKLLTVIFLGAGGRGPFKILLTGPKTYYVDQAGMSITEILLPLLGIKGHLTKTVIF